MGDDTTGTSKIHDYYKLSCTYYESARISLKNELFEPDIEFIGDFIEQHIVLLLRK